MSRSGVVVSQECISDFNDLKLAKKYKFIVFKLSDDYKEVIVDHKEPVDPAKTPSFADQNSIWEEKLRPMLIDAKETTKTGETKPSPRYVVYDVEYQLKGGEGQRNKIIFLLWNPSEASIKSKMVSASTEQSLKNTLNGIAGQVQADNEGELKYSVVVGSVSKQQAEGSEVA